MNCRNCKADCAEKGTDHEKKSCLGYLGKTNADRIRSMTDEELAEWLDYICDAYYMPDPTGWLNWLKEEAKGGGI